MIQPLKKNPANLPFKVWLAVDKFIAVLKKKKN